MVISLKAETIFCVLRGITVPDPKQTIMNSVSLFDFKAYVAT